MATQINSIQWSKTLPLDRTKSPPVYESFLSSNNRQFSNCINEETRSSLLYSAKLRQSLEESRKAFLNLFGETENDGYDTTTISTPITVTTTTTIAPITTPREDDHNKENTCQEQRKLPTKKISFKIKKSPSIYKRTPKHNANNVAQLTNKFNNLLNEHKSVLDKPKIAKLMRQVNTCSEKDNVCNKIVRKPSVKIKPDDKKTYVIKKISVKRRVSVKRMPRKEYQSDKSCVRAKVSYLESPQNAQSSGQQHNEFNNKTCVPNPMLPGSVRATIKIFEQRSTSGDLPKDVSQTKSLKLKPEVPAKNFSQEQKMKLLKNAERSAKILIDKRKESLYDEENEKTETDLVQIINIPLNPPRKCESNYETIRKISPIKNNTYSDLSAAKTNNSTDAQTDYKPNNSFLWRRSSSQRISVSSSTSFLEQEQELNTKETYCDLLNEEASCQQPRETSIELNNDSENWEDLYDKVDPTIGQVVEESIEPQLKEILPSNTTTNAKDCRPVNVLPLPPKKVYKRKISPPKVPEPPIVTLPSNNDTNSDYEEVGHKSDNDYECLTHEENIYETLPIINAAKPSINVRPLPPRPPSTDSDCTKTNDDDNSPTYETIYISGTCKQQDDDNYETIYTCNKHWSTASNRDSIVSSEQQSNSLYGIRSWSEEVFNTYSGKAISDVSTSDKSEDWIDMSDNEENRINSKTGFLM